MTSSAERLTILRTAAGSPPSISEFQVFKKLGIRIVGVDCDPLSVGLFFADAGYEVPRASDPDYIDALIEICKKESVNWIVPSLDEEFVVIASNKASFEAIGTRICISSVDTLRICTNKFATYEFFSQNKIPTVPTALFRENTKPAFNNYPQIVKPILGRGGTNVFVARSQSEVEFFGKYLGEAVVQPMITGVEYTIDVLGSWSSEPLIIAPRKRLATDSGISMKGITTWHKEMVYMAGEIVKRLKIIGPANIQCFVTEQGEMLFTEINARLAGTSILSQGAGVPLLESLIALLNGKEPLKYIHPADERIMLRYWSELFLTIEEAQKFGWKKNA